MRHLITCLSPRFCLLTTFILLGGCSLLHSNAQDSCLENRATIDIGSGSSKILVATVNTCIHKIEKILHQEATSLKFKEALKTHKGALPEAMLNESIQTLNQWKITNKRFKVLHYEAVATEVFRQATNGTQFIKTLSETTSIPIRIIDQQEEAQLGFWAAIASSEKSVHEVVVWDIGGGSMQMISYDPSGHYLFYMGQMASVSFKDQILKKQKAVATAKSPNPLGKKLATEATLIAENFAHKQVPAKIKEELNKKLVVGIGGVHSKSIKTQVLATKDTPHVAHRSSSQTAKGVKSDQKDIESSAFSFSQDDLKKTLLSRAHFNDDQLASAYPETDVTNLALVLGFMKALHVPQVEVISTDLTSGILLMSLSSTHQNDHHKH
ncbi:MAG: hypothetical protein M9899_06730 [Bdellovibrionaceae bacterium]|nr:hypothetical protein [Pseudobdellovibrionaceae bacterium]